LPGGFSAAVCGLRLVDTVEELTGLTRQLARQTYRNFELTVIARKDAVRARPDIIGRGLTGIEARILPPSTGFPEPLCQAPAGSYVWLVNLQDYYGENFLNDAALATVYSDAEVIGKATHFQFHPTASKPELVQLNQEFRFVRTVSPGSIIAKAGKLNADHWKALAANRTPDLSNFKLLSIDRFNFVKCAGDRAHVESNDAAILPAAASV